MGRRTLPGAFCPGSWVPWGEVAEKGQGIIELALTLPFLLALASAILDGGYAFHEFGLVAAAAEARDRGHWLWSLPRSSAAGVRGRCSRGRRNGSTALAPGWPPDIGVVCGARMRRPGEDAGRFRRLSSHCVHTLACSCARTPAGDGAGRRCRGRGRTSVVGAGRQGAGARSPDRRPGAADWRALSGRELLLFPVATNERRPGECVTDGELLLRSMAECTFLGESLATTRGA